LNWIYFFLGLGGIDSRVQSRLRCLETTRCTFSICWDFLDSQDVGFWNVKIEGLDQDLNKKIFQHFRVIETVKIFSTHQDVIFEVSRCRFLKCQDREPRSRACWDKTRHSGLRFSEANSRKTEKMSILTKNDWPVFFLNYFFLHIVLSIFLESFKS
jgi:hypothetical protein